MHRSDPLQQPRLAACLILLVMLNASPAQAAIFCVSNSAELQSALDAADSNGQDDVIRIEQGTYAVPQGAPFTYRGGATFNGDNNDLTIVGGFVDNGNPCGFLPPGAGANETVLTGENRERVMDINAGEGTDITLIGLSFILGSPSEGGVTRGGGLELGTFNETAGTFLVQRCLFLGNQAEFSGAATINDARTVRFINNVVVGNTTETATAAVSLVQNDETGIYAINNTIINNLTEGGFNNSATTGLYVFVSGSSRAFVANNILWGNEYKDVTFLGDGFITSRNNTIQAQVGSADSSIDNVSIAPVFQSGLLNYNLVVNSPLANLGVNPPLFIPFPPEFNLNWSLPGDDLDGGPRITNGRVDLGAYETPQDGLFSDRFQAP